MSQYTLDISPISTYSAQQFVTSASNQAVYETVMNWKAWPNHALYLQGDVGAGKTHLSHVWAEQTGALFLSPDATDLPNTPSIIDNVECWKNETALFHLFNHCKHANLPLLITSSQLPNALPFTLPDICSRLRAMALVQLLPPDDLLMQAVLTKLLADLQLKIDPAIIDYLLPRLERSLAAVVSAVGRLNEASLQRARTLTIPFIRETLGW